MDNDFSQAFDAFITRLTKTTDLENNLYKTGLNPQEWFEILMEKSKFIRENYLANQKTIDTIFIPFMNDPSLMPDDLIEELSHAIYNLNVKNQIIDSFFMFDFSLVLYNELVKRKFSLPIIINTLAIIINSGTFLFNIDCDKKSVELSRAMFSYSKKFEELTLNTLDERRARKNILLNTFKYIYQLIDIHYLAKTHDYIQIYNEVEFVIDYIKYYKNCNLTDKEVELLDLNLHSIIILVIDMLATFNRSFLHGQLKPFSDTERECEVKILNNALAYFSKYLENNNDDVEAQLRLLYIKKSLGILNINNYYLGLQQIYINKPSLSNLEDLAETYKYDYYVICPSLMMDAIYENEEIDYDNKINIYNVLFNNTISLLEKNKKSVSNQRQVKIITDFIHDTFVYLENANNILIRKISELFYHQQLFTALHQEMVAQISMIITEGLFDMDMSLFDSTLVYKTDDTITRKKEKVLEYAYNAGLLHDFGKIKYYDIINMQYRRVTNNEYETIKRHVITGYELLKSNNGLSKYADVARKHHIYYNQTDGYPTDALNAHSKYDIFVDIVSVADAMDAATDILGRNYSQGKKFTEIYNELLIMKNSRYNPIVIELIEKNVVIRNRLEKLVDTDRKNVYEQCYLKYLSK